MYVCIVLRTVKIIFCLAEIVQGKRVTLLISN